MRCHLQIVADLHSPESLKTRMHLPCPVDVEAAPEALHPWTPLDQLLDEPPLSRYRAVVARHEEEPRLPRNMPTSEWVWPAAAERLP